MPCLRYPSANREHLHTASVSEPRTLRPAQGRPVIEEPSTGVHSAHAPSRLPSPPPDPQPITGRFVEILFETQVAFGGLDEACWSLSWISSSAARPWGRAWRRCVTGLVG